MTLSTIGPINTQNSYLPPEQDYPEDDKLFREILSERERMTAEIVNIKEIAQYEKQELITAQQWFTSTVSGQAISNYGFRLTFDLVTLNGGSIANGGPTTIAVPTDPAINTPTVIQYTNGLIPLHGFGAATGGTTCYFINDPNLYVRYVNTSPTVQAIVITNTTGVALTQCYWVFEYLKF